MLTDATLGTLVMADVLSSLDYAECAAKHRAVVDAYDAVRAQFGAK